VNLTWPDWLVLNVNVIWGCVLTVAGGAMLALAYRR